MVAIFASLLFQSGLEFWFSDRARGMIEDAGELGRTTYDDEVFRVGNEAVTMSGDLSSYLEQVTIDDPLFAEGFAAQVLNRNLSEAIIFRVDDNGEVQSFALVNPYDRNLQSVIKPGDVEKLGDNESVAVNSEDRIGALTRLNYVPDSYLYTARVFDPDSRSTRG